MLDGIMAQRPTREWVTALEAAGIPCSPVQSIEQMAEHPQTQALGLIQPVPGTGMRFVALPLSLDGQRPVSTGPPPTLGEHTESILFPRS